ncbi:MAG: hypothetical protein ACT4OJ_09245 [Bacteroidota bacterium]
MKRNVKSLLLSGFVLILSGIILAGCFGSMNKEGEAGPEDIYLDYKIWGEEGEDSVMVMLQFREYDAYGPTIRIDGPGSVTLDGKKIPGDSSKMTGPYYAVTRQVKEFTGLHTIVFTSADKVKHKEEFYFRPFTLKTQITDTLKRDRLSLQFEGLEKRDIVRVLLTDTSLTGDGINRLDTIWNNKLTLTRNALSYLENGPIHLELIKELEKPVENHTGAGGTILILYTIRREFVLQD